MNNQHENQMRLSKILLIFLVAFQMISCAGSMSRVELTQYVEKIKKEGDAEALHRMCRSYNYHRGEDQKAALKAAGIFTEREWDAIDSKKIFIGMSYLALNCSWGPAGLWGSINKSVGPWGTRLQIVFRECRTYCPTTYVYVENGKISSWSN